MDNQLLGALIGLALAVVNFMVFGMIIRNRQARAGNNDIRQQGGPDVLDLVRKADFVLLPVILYFAFGFIKGQIIG